jgi:hypothetical protein
MLQNGVALNAIRQTPNCVARFDRVEIKELKGFIVRDFGGLHVHTETTKGVDFDFIKGLTTTSNSLYAFSNSTTMGKDGQHGLNFILDLNFAKTRYCIQTALALYNHLVNIPCVSCVSPIPYETEGRPSTGRLGTSIIILIPTVEQDL